VLWDLEPDDSALGLVPDGEVAFVYFDILLDFPEDWTEED
jgi:hypothetical protein